MVSKPQHGQCPAVTPGRFKLEGVRVEDVLFSGVGELVLSPAVVGLLDARVSPQRLYCADVRLIKRRDLLHLHLAYQLGVILFDKDKFNIGFFNHSRGHKK